LVILYEVCSMWCADKGQFWHCDPLKGKGCASLNYTNNFIVCVHFCTACLLLDECKNTLVNFHVHDIFSTVNVTWTPLHKDQKWNMDSKYMNSNVVCVLNVSWLFPDTSMKYDRDKCKHFDVWNSITNYTKWSPWDANSHSASREIPYLWWNPKVHYHVLKSPPSHA